MKPEQQAVFSSEKSGGGGNSPRRRVLLVAGALLAVVAVVAVIAYTVEHSQPKRLVTSVPSEMDTNLGTTDEKNIPTVLAYKYNVTLDDLKTKPLAFQIKSYDMARDVSTVFGRLGDNKRALAAYKIADQKRPSSAPEVDFRQHYCAFAYQAGDVTLAKKQCDLALKALASQPESDYRHTREADIKSVIRAHEVDNG